MAAATETRQKKAEQDAPGSASKPESAGGTNAPKTKGSRSTGRANGNGRSGSNGKGQTGANGNGRSGSTRSHASKSRSNGNGGERASAKGKSTSNARKAKGPVKQAAKSTAKKAAKSTMDAATDVAEEGTSISKPKKFAAKLAWKAIKRTTRKLADGSLTSAADLARLAAEKAAKKGHETFTNPAHQRLPIQRSVDVAVPLKIAWEEWLALDSLPEGVDTVSEIERDGDALVGHIDGPRSRGCVAEVIDEREEQSFAWQSHEGSDCAGLVTFHELSGRLTRLELNLDVVPSGVGETLKLSTHLADRRAEAELRRFKARVELINPDEYEDELREDEDDDETEDRDEPPGRSDDGDRDDADRDPDANDADESDAD